MDDQRRDERRRRTSGCEDGGARLVLDGEASADGGAGEYPDIYRTFVDLIDKRRSLVDVAPLRLVADCLLVGARKTVEASTMLMEQLAPGHLGHRPAFVTI